MLCRWDGHSVVMQRDSCPKAPEKAVIFSWQANSGDQLRNQIYTFILCINEILVEVECGISEDAKNIYNPGDLDSAFSFPRWRETPQNFLCPSWSDIFHMDKYLYPLRSPSLWRKSKIPPHTPNNMQFYICFLVMSVVFAHCEKSQTVNRVLKKKMDITSSSIAQE